MNTPAGGASLFGMRNKHIRSTLALAFVVASLGALGSLAGPVSTASAAASIDHLNYLDFPNKGSHSNICSAARRMRLRGTYNFRAYTSHRLHPQHTFANTRQLRLHGVYAWQVCLVRIFLREYVIQAQVRNLATGGKAKIKHRELGGVYGDGYYDWGSTLANVRG